jgi:protein SCO1
MKRAMAFRRAFLIATVAVLHLQAALAAASYRLTEWPAVAPRPDFQLVDMNGHRRSLRDYAGSVSIVFFGYTHCPDVCPGELLELSQVVRKLGPLASHVQVLFISLDPERDTPELLKDYVTSFDPRFIGLTGSNAEINAAAAGFSVQFAKVALGNDFTVGHSTGTYVLDQTGRLRLVGTLQTSLDDWVHDLQILMGEGFPNGPNSTKK